LVSASGFAEDCVPLQMMSMGYKYEVGRQCFQEINLKVPQGCVLAIMSNTEHGGRSTLLRLLGQCLAPTEGHIFIPTHLRVLHVSNKPMMMDTSLWDNLVFGARETPRARVLDILKDLEMQQSLEEIQKAADEPDKAEGQKKDPERWQVSFPFSELAKVHLARVFVMSPEVAVFQRPLLHISQGSSRAQVLRMIRNLADNRGVHLPQESAHRRRPRTVCFTPELEAEAEHADRIWTIQAGGRISVRKGRGANAIGKT